MMNSQQQQQGFHLPHLPNIQSIPNNFDHPHQQHLQSNSPPLPNLQSLSISPYPTGLGAIGGNAIGIGGNSDYRYNGVFGPPDSKRGSRVGLPQNWYDPAARESPNPHFDAFRRDVPSPPALSPSTSTNSNPTTGSSNLQQSQAAHNPYAAYPYPDPSSGSYASMAVTPSPPPQLGFGMGGMSTTNSVPNLNLNLASMGYNPGGMPTYGSQSLAALTSRSTNGYLRNGYGNLMQSSIDDDVIPTAIVIKNIPFAVSRDTLLGVIESLGAPLPYAFNYHHDNGVFRGLAFANFRAPEEAASVVAALNGYDVQGRKLRVEYKKVLQPGEKDKIEREKALKRMRSVQFDKDLMPPPITVPSHSTPLNGIHDNSPPQSATSSGHSDTLPMSLDLNDAMSLDIYSRVLVFKEDRMRDELAFSRNLTPTERRIVHLVAQKLGLTSQTKIEGDSKLVVVTRDPSRPNLTSSSTTTSIPSSVYLSPYATSQSQSQSQSQNELNSISPSLRIKKSMPDLRGFNGPVVARDPTRSLTPQRSSGTLRDNYNNSKNDRDYSSMGTSQGRRIGLGSGSGSGSFNGLFGSPLDIPPVPPIPSSYNNSSGSASGSNYYTASNLHRTSAPSLNGSNLSTVSSSPPNPGLVDDNNTTTSIGLSTSASNGGTIATTQSQSQSQTQPVRNPRGPAGESRGFGLRTSASQSTITRGSGGVIGRRVDEESEEGVAGSRESLDI